MALRAQGGGEEPFLTALLESEPALLGATTSPPSPARVFAVDYGNEHLRPKLTRIWPLPDDLPHAAGTGNAEAVARWFDTEGKHARAGEILHECAIRGDEESVRWLLENRVDVTIKYHRYQANAEGWARYAGGHERVANLLAEATARQ